MDSPAVNERSVDEAAPVVPTTVAVLGARNKRKRGEYNTRACLNCRRRKIKCSGGLTCADCQKNGEVCIPPDTRRKRRAMITQNDNPQINYTQHAVATSESPGNDRGIPEAISDCVRAMNVRLAGLERGLGRGAPILETHENQDPVTTTIPCPQSYGTHCSTNEIAGTSSMPDGTSARTTAMEARNESLQDLLCIEKSISATDDHGFAICSTVRDADMNHTPRDHVHKRLGPVDINTSTDNFVEAPDVVSIVNNATQHLSGVDRLLEDVQEVRLPSDETDIEGTRGSSSLVLLIEDLDRVVGQDTQPTRSSEPEIVVLSSSMSRRPADLSGHQPRISDELCHADETVRRDNGANMRVSLNEFFRTINPHHPIINETQLRARFEDYIDHMPGDSRSPQACEFLALLLLIDAETKLLGYKCRSQDPVPGRHEFDTADRILDLTTFRSRDTLVSIQCLVIKVRYLLYLEHLDSAYDAMSRVVRLCFQSKLHNRASLDGLDGFEVAMRQRIFWLVFQLDRSLSYIRGLPHLIRSEDFNIDFAQCFDDHALGPGRPLPHESFAYSSIPYLNGVIRWSNLHYEIWSQIFGVNAETHPAKTLVDDLDQKTLKLSSMLPAHLQYAQFIESSPEVDYYAPYIHRQRVSLHVRSNHLRLLLRQNQMMTLSFDEDTATQCLDVCKDSIDCLSAYYLSSSVLTDRYFCTMSLTAAIIPLSCIIVKSGRDIGNQIQTKAIDLFLLAIETMQNMAPTFQLTRRMISRLSGIIQAVEKIRRNNTSGQGLPRPSLPNCPDGSTSRDPGSVAGELICPGFELNEFLGSFSGRVSPILNWGDEIWDPPNRLGGENEHLLYPMLLPTG